MVAGSLQDVLARGRLGAGPQVRAQVAAREPLPDQPVALLAEPEADDGAVAVVASHQHADVPVSGAYVHPGAEEGNVLGAHGAIEAPPGRAALRSRKPACRTRCGPTGGASMSGFGQPRGQEIQKAGDARRELRVAVVHRADGLPHVGRVPGQ